MSEQNSDKNKRPVSHGVLLKAVNHPVRRRMLEIVNSNDGITKNELLNQLIENNIIPDENSFEYNMSFLLQAECIREGSVAGSGKIRLHITLAGKVVEHYE